MNLRLGDHRGDLRPEPEGCVSIPVLVNLRLGVHHAAALLAGRLASVSIPVLVNLRLGVAVYGWALVVSRLSQFLFW